MNIRILPNYGFASSYGQVWDALPFITGYLVKYYRILGQVL